ncbi:MAG TPA: hydrogenase maturation nickel metallochaperone HypA [Candidatus Acidoferrum sp.]|jgi:hydrogenase nickel incorporation protein HypA/HybF
MHELSIAMSIVELAEEELAARKGATVQSVHLKLGSLSGVSRAALESCYEMACFESPLAGSQLIIEEVPVSVNCPKCAEIRQLDSIQLFQCPVCGGSVSDIVTGKELQVVALEILE